MLPLYRNKRVGSIFAIVVILCTDVATHAQSDLQQKYNKNHQFKEINLPAYDDRLLHYGFFLALNYNRVSLRPSQYYYDNMDYYRITPVGNAGFSLGFLMNIRLHDQWALKAVPSIGFYDRSVLLHYRDAASGDTLEKIFKAETAIIETQFLAKYKSLRRHNHRFYLIAGVKPGIRAGGRGGTNGGGIGGVGGRDNRDNVMGFGRYDLTIEYGVGVDLYFEYFKFSPELRFSHGLLNTNSLEGNSVVNQAISRMYTHTVTLYFFFE